MNLKIASETELNIIRGKLMAGHANLKEIQEFFKYVMLLEIMVDEAESENFYGDNDLRKRAKWEEE